MTVLATVKTWAHGEDKPGPHGGFISMPGAFHVELVPVSKNKVKAYLLDIDWKNPTVKDSSVELSRGQVNAKCTMDYDFFTCEFPKPVDLTKKGQIDVKATREKQIGNSVSYQLPLKLTNKHH